MTIDCTSVPKWLKVMRAITGTTETPGSADNPKIMGMRDWIACTYDEMMHYCEGYDHDDVPWCGLTAAFCMTVAGIRPPFGPADTDRFLWALSWADDGGFHELQQPVLGCVVVMEREGGGHVTLYESTDGDHYRCRGGNQSDAVNVQSYPISSVVALVWPAGVPMPGPGPDPNPIFRTLKEGDSGSDVAEVQRILGIPADGEFGEQTTAAVEGFQAAMGMSVDGIVGEHTWHQLERLDARMAAGDELLDLVLQEDIVQLAMDSEIARYDWNDRGQAPAGYTPGMALAFALAVKGLRGGDPAFAIMAQAAGDPDTDALAAYDDAFDDLDMDNRTAGVDTLRHLFDLMIGLGMRESSGIHWEGRDQGASNVEADTCESGLFQTSWNISSASPQIERLFNHFWADPNGFRGVFSDDVTAHVSDLENYGRGELGTKYQWLAKYCPVFAVFSTAVGLRTRCSHWGPVVRGEVEIKQEADELLKRVQRLV